MEKRLYFQYHLIFCIILFCSGCYSWWYSVYKTRSIYIANWIIYISFCHLEKNVTYEALLGEIFPKCSNWNQWNVVFWYRLQKYNVFLKKFSTACQTITFSMCLLYVGIFLTKCSSSHAISNPIFLASRPMWLFYWLSHTY
jgi:hypothetical protein